jgi:hypothetical protein
VNGKRTGKTGKGGRSKRERSKKGGRIDEEI